MRTVGIDLASAEGTTGVCTIDWHDDHASVTRLEDHRFGIDELVDCASDRDAWVAIDAPFGFPVGFVEALAGWSETGRFPCDPDAAEAHRALIRRVTDCFVRDRTAPRTGTLDGSRPWPMSPVVERITVTTMRAGWLLARLHPGTTPDRTGSTGRVIETYPNAVLSLWDLLPREPNNCGKGKVVTYRGAGALDRRHAMVTRLAPEGVVRFETGVGRERLAESDDLLDAYVCALAARYASRPDRPTSLDAGLVHDPSVADRRGEVEREGWIHLPLDYCPHDDCAHVDHPEGFAPSAAETLVRLWQLERWSP